MLNFSGHNSLFGKWLSVTPKCLSFSSFIRVASHKGAKLAFFLGAGMAVAGEGWHFEPDLVRKRNFMEVNSRQCASTYVF